MHPPALPILELQWTNVEPEPVRSVAPPVQSAAEYQERESSNLETSGVEFEVLNGANLETGSALCSSDPCQTNGDGKLGWDLLPFSSSGSWTTLLEGKETPSRIRKALGKRKQEEKMPSLVKSNAEPRSTIKQEPNETKISNGQSEEHLGYRPHEGIHRRRHVILREVLVTPADGKQVRQLRHVRNRMAHPDLGAVEPELTTDDHVNFSLFLFGSETCADRDLERFVYRLNRCKFKKGDRKWSGEEFDLLKNAQGILRCPMDHAALRMCLISAVDLLFDAVEIRIESYCDN